MVARCDLNIVWSPGVTLMVARCDLNTVWSPGVTLMVARSDYYYLLLPTTTTTTTCYSRTTYYCLLVPITSYYYYFTTITIIQTLQISVLYHHVHTVSPLIHASSLLFRIVYLLFHMVSYTYSFA